ncbi:ankyrin repeat domain-containing protein [Clostridium sp. YIM B02505]|uniref:Ankyrin repeat domain-containing protein n=1 Tax=Clostridium yunnanense TaxID=2800325 RepID=A0ABS1EUL1_9CLOT|nr:ankyrin repeat domain-containing protein [Clostridium yunnanense]MBK1813025.1 ankyrin repeat domain-containing protein [Clostridium yunnanense]
MSIAYTPLEIAFRYSADIVRYIYTEFRQQFDKEVSKKGFGIATETETEDIELLQLLFNYGCDINCLGNPFPPLHSFADFNNTVGIKFLLDKGVDVNTKNQYKQTAIDRARRRNNQEAIDLLETYYSFNN